MADPKRRGRADAIRTVVLWIVVLLAAILAIPLAIVIYADLTGGV